jgi:translocator protein
MAFKCPTLLQVAHVLLFVVTLVLNGLSSRTDVAPGLFPKSNAQITDERKTAVTPAGYAFSIWGLIYIALAALMVFQALPRNAAWTRARLGGWLLLNLASNAVWLPVFQNEVAGGLWASVGVIAGGILLPLTVLHTRFWRPASLEAMSWGEAVCVLPAISLYMGWVSVATIANVSLALTPPGTVVASLGGWPTDNWAVTILVVAALLPAAVLAATRGRDWIYPLPVSWALVAIGVRQRDPAYPGGPMVVNAAFALAALVGAAAAVAAIAAAVRTCRGCAARRAGARRAQETGTGKGGATAVVVGNPAQFVGASQAPNFGGAGSGSAGAYGNDDGRPAEWR